jgi:RND family efflux transporter MFP subunit
MPPQAASRSGERLSNDRRSLQRRLRLLPVLLTFMMALLGCASVWLLWQGYMERPWTRDGTVRSNVVTLAPDVSGQIVELDVRNNQFVHRGDLLMKIDPRDYRVTVDLTKAAVDQAQADYDNKKVEADRRVALNDLATSREERQSYVASAAIAAATVEQQKANLARAVYNLARTEIRSPVNGWVTNLLVQRGDYAATGQTAMSLVDADSFWVDAYFEETALKVIHDGDPAKIWLLGYREVLAGHVQGVARGIVVSNAVPGRSGLATVEPVFTWVRLAQRIPVEIQLDHVPADLRLVIGMTATVEIEEKPRSADVAPASGGKAISQ